MKKRLNIVVSGRVQGVFYRIKTKEKAEEFNLAGWVKNRPDGKVEILAEGEDSDLEELIDWCYKGPGGAVVDGIKINWSEHSGKFDQFKILL